MFEYVFIMPPLWDLCRLFVAVGLVRLISQGHGHCDVAAALLERKADKAECGPSSSCKNPMICQIEQCQPSYPFQWKPPWSSYHHSSQSILGVWYIWPKQHLQTREVRLQADINHRSSSQLTALSAACERGSALDAACCRLWGWVQLSRTPVRWDAKVRVAHGCFCKLLLIATRLDWGTWEPGNRKVS